MQRGVAVNAQLELAGLCCVFYQWPDMRMHAPQQHVCTAVLNTELNLVGDSKRGCRAAGGSLTPHRGGGQGRR